MILVIHFIINTWIYMRAYIDVYIEIYACIVNFFACRNDVSSLVRGRIESR